MKFIGLLALFCLATPLFAQPPPPAAAEPGFITLLDENHTDGWEQSGPGGMIVKDGVATTWTPGDGRPDHGLYWYNKRPFGDFTLRLEFKVDNPAANSGVYVRFPDLAKDPLVADAQGCEIDIHGDKPGRFNTGALFHSKAASAVPLRADDWNDLEITVVGDAYSVRLNSEPINEGHGGRNATGYIGLQNARADGEAHFRHVRIRELTGPQAVGLAAAPPAPEANSQLPAPYAKILTLMEDPWTGDVRNVRSIRSINDPARWVPVLDQFTDGKNAAVNATIKKLRDDKAAVDRTVDGINLSSQLAAQHIADQYDEIDSRQSRYGLRYETSGQRDSDTFSAGMEAGFLNGFLTVMKRRFGEYATHMIYVRNGAMYELAHRLDKVYPPTPAENTLVTARITHDSIEFVNISGRRLTEVTVVAYLVHFTTAPEASSYKICYVESLASGASIHVPVNFQREAKRPAAANLTYGDEGAWLSRAGGVVEIRLGAWALEAHQPEVSVRFPEHALSAGRFELDAAVRVFRRAQPQKVPGTHPPVSLALFFASGGEFDPYELIPYDWAVEAVKRVLGFVPPDSTLTAEAKSILANPGAAGRLAEARAVERLNSFFPGRFKVTSTSKLLWGANTEPDPYNTKQAVAKNAIDDRGTVLEIRRAGKNNALKAVLDPDRNGGLPFSGELSQHADTSDWLQLDEDRKSRRDTMLDYARPLIGFRLGDFVSRFTLEIQGDHLVGTAVGAMFGYELTFTRIPGPEPASSPAASAAPSASPPKAFANVEEAKREALRRYPELGVNGSAFNREFVARVKKYQQGRPAYFADNAWPLTLAEEVKAALARGP